MKVAVGEEYCPGAMSAYQWGLFPEVWSVAGNDDLSAYVALTALTSQSVGPTAAGTQTAGLKHCPGLLNPGFQFPGLTHPLVDCHLSYSSSSLSSSGSLLSFLFLITSTGIGGGTLETDNVFLVLFFGFFGSRWR